MLKMLRRVVLALTVILSVSAVGHADTIFNVLPTNIAVPGPLGFSRFFAAPGPWTDNFLPTGFSGSFQTFRSYNNVSGQILLGASSGTPEVTVSIAKEGPNGEPGTILGSATFFVAGNGMAQLYDFSLTNLVLEDASTYQLFVSTTAAPGPESMTGGFTSWCGICGAPGLPKAYQSVVTYPTIPGMYITSSLAFAISGTEIGNPIVNGDPVPTVGLLLPYGFPEPSAVWSLGVGLAALALLARLKAKLLTAKTSDL